jgi:hypothetical protein
LETDNLIVYEGNYWEVLNPSLARDIEDELEEERRDDAESSGDF